MNIYLTSYGIDIRYSKYMNSYDEIIRILKDKNVAIICNAKLKTQDRANSIIAKNELNKHGIKADIVDLNEEKIEIKKYKAVYFSGGEPKYLMDAIINNGYYDEILEFMNDGNIVIGQSAGAMIMSKNYLDTSEGRLQILKNGFDVCKKIVVPHYENLDNGLLIQIPKDVFKIKDSDKLIKIK